MEKKTEVQNDGVKKRPVSPVNGVPLPEGRRFEPGERQREISRKAGKRSQELRKQRKTLKEELERLLCEEVTSRNGEKMQANVAISASMINQAMKGNVKAYAIIRDTIGEKPVERVIVNIPDPDIIKNVESALFGSDDK